MAGHQLFGVKPNCILVSEEEICGRCSHSSDDLHGRFHLAFGAIASRWLIDSRGHKRQPGDNSGTQRSSRVFELFYRPPCIGYTKYNTTLKVMTKQMLHQHLMNYKFKPRPTVILTLIYLFFWAFCLYLCHRTVKLWTGGKWERDGKESAKDPGRNWSA